MLDVGWTELVVIAIVMIIVVGPKDPPPMLRTFGKMMTKMRGMANDFRQQFDEALKEADLDDVRKTLSEAQKLNPAHSIREAMNPLRQMGNDIKADLQKATTVDTKPKEPVVPAPAEVAAEAVVPQEQPKADAVAAAAIASAAKQMERAAEAEKPKAKRASKPKTDMAQAAVSQPVKAPEKGKGRCVRGCEAEGQQGCCQDDQEKGDA
ncbi:Sec-independent protein translocase protein TatB [Rhizobium sp. RCAM05350]|nr:Sec-independent protein translocase protein TatB [Rhizobium sp. RCAM05350]